METGIDKNRAPEVLRHSYSVPPLSNKKLKTEIEFPFFYTYHKLYIIKQYFYRFCWIILNLKQITFFLEGRYMASTATIEEKVRMRAFELFEKRERQSGHELEDWLTAEKEIKELNMKINNMKGKKGKSFN